MYEKGWHHMGSLFSRWGLVYLHLFCYTVEPLMESGYGRNTKKSENVKSKKKPFLKIVQQLY